MANLPGCIVAVEGPTANQSAIYRRASSAYGFPTLEKDGVAINTLYELFAASAAKHADLPALGHRPTLVSTPAPQAPRHTLSGRRSTS
jgi:hypothetical protein